MSKSRGRMDWMPRLFSPVGLLLLAGFSYVWLLADTEFPVEHMGFDLACLGALSLLLGLKVVRYRFHAVMVSAVFANRLLSAAIALLFSVSSALFIVTGGSVNALLDERFAIPAYGLVYGIYFVCAVVVGATWRQQNAPWRRMAFLLLYGYVGLIAGGKGFVLPFIFGLGLAHLLGLRQIHYGWFVGLAVFAMTTAAYVVYSLVDDLDAVWLILGTRIAMAADAIVWTSKISANDLVEFPVSAWQIVVDLLSRWVGLRMTPAAVGSVLASMVNGDDGGGGPNPLLPVMAYLVNRGSLVASTLFVVLMLGLLALFLFATGKWLLRTREGKFFHAVLVFLSPLFVIDVFLYWQAVVCLTLLGGICLVLKWMAVGCKIAPAIQSSPS